MIRPENEKTSQTYSKLPYLSAYGPEAGGPDAAAALFPPGDIALWRHLHPPRALAKQAADF